MTEYERIPTGLLHNTDELKKLIIENPDLPLLVFASDECNNGDYSYMSCDCYAVIGEVLDCMQEINDERIYEDRDEFREDLEYIYEDQFDGSDEEFDKLIDSKMEEYEPYWKKCIILYVHE